MTSDRVLDTGELQSNRPPASLTVLIAKDAVVYDFAFARVFA